MGRSPRGCQWDDSVPRPVPESRGAVLVVVPRPRRFQFRTPRTHRRPVLSMLLVACGLMVGAVAAAPTAFAAPVPNWHLFGLTPSNQTLASPVARGQGGDLATFDFPSSPTANYLLTSQGSQKGTLLGDLTGNKTITATFSITGTAPTFFYDTTDNPCGTPASVRLFFETSNAGGFNETHYWWSNPVSFSLALTTDPSLTVPVSGADWSDFFGHFGNDTSYSAGFNAAAANVTSIGLSFGGGCFFANGVGVSPGSATFRLTDFTVS